MAFLLDLAVVLVLALAAWRGWMKGFVLSLCGLLAVVVAFVGSTYISSNFSEPVGDFLHPYILSHLENALEEIPGQVTTPTDAPTPSFGLPVEENTDALPEALDATLSDILMAVRNSELLSRLSDSIETAIQDGSLTVVTTKISAVASYLAHQIARVGLFFVSFVLILVIWWLFSYMVDLAFHLPVLRTLNEAGGLVLGIIKGGMLLVFVCWAVVAFEVLPAEVTAQTNLFSLFLRFQII